MRAVMNILIADDNLTTRNLLETYLTKWGYGVVAASDGNRAWEIMQGTSAPDIVILDWMMPGIDGPEVCRRIRTLETGSLKHVILLTARESREDIVAGFEAGADDYITKGFDSDELRSRVKVGERLVGLQTALKRRVSELENALSHIKTLQGILPICMHCHKVRDDREIWQKLEEYIAEHTDAMPSHCLCPDCFSRLYPDYSAGAALTDKKEHL